MSHLRRLFVFTKIIRVFGLIFIILFSVSCIFVSMAQREINVSSFNSFWRTAFSMPSYFEDRFYDHRMNLTLDPKKVDKRIVLARIDDNSIKKIGRFPWSRSVWSKFINKMNSYGAKVVAFDVFFSESEEVCNKISPDVDMANAIKDFQSIPGNKIVLPYSMRNPGDNFFTETPDSLYNFVMDTKQSENLNLDQGFVSKAVYPISLLVDTEAALGHIGAKEDLDGIFRHYRLVANFDTLYFPSFGLLAYELYTKDKPVLELLQEGSSKLKLKSGSMSINAIGEAKVRWLGGMGHFPEVAISDILDADDNDKKMREVFSGNIVFVGSTAFGAHDLRHTPVNSMLPGVFVHMNMTHMMLEGLFFNNKSDSTKISWAILLVGTFLMIFIQFFGHAIIDLLCMLIMSSGIYLFDIFYLTPQGYEIKLAFCIFSIVACYSWTTFLNFYLTSKDKNFLKSAFGNYISPELIDEMYKSGQPPKLGGDVGVRTAYFTDIQGFSTFSEKLSAPKLVELLNEYLTEMTNILLAESGTLDKYEGDAIIAFFGAPMPLPDHAQRSCRVALDMQDSLKKLRKKWVDEGEKWPEIVHNMRMRIGINAGEIVTGNMGSANRMNYTMMGDAVNLAARLEEAAKQYGIFSHISDAIKKLIGDEFELRELDTIRVVGKSEPVTTYDLLGEKGKLDDTLKGLQENFHKGLALYKNQKWDEAISFFEKSLEFEHLREPGLVGKINPSLIYIDRSKEFKENPPPENWDGVYTLTKK